MRLQLEESLSYLIFARRLHEESRQDLVLIDAVIKQAQDELSSQDGHDGEMIVPRRRPVSDSDDNRYTIFIDECGNHALNSKEPFTTFCLSAVVVPDRNLANFDELWCAWKTLRLGAKTKLAHEKDLRARSGSFWCGGSVERQTEAIQSLDNCIDLLPYTGFVCVLERPRFVARFGKDSVDASLPRHTYLLTVNLLAERIALAIDTQWGGGKARWIIESRGPKEDAAFQYEFARLFLDGTSYLSPHYFRKLFLPGLTFLCKEDNSAGLQLADFQARPCAEKVMRPDTDPARWASFRKKLCDGKETVHTVLGLKILPWDDAYGSL